MKIYYSLKFAKKNDQLCFIYIISWFTRITLRFFYFIMIRLILIYIYFILLNCYFWFLCCIFTCSCSFHKHFYYFCKAFFNTFSCLSTNLYHINSTSKVLFILCLSNKFSIEKFSTSLLFSASSILLPTKNIKELFLF